MMNAESNTALAPADRRGVARAILNFLSEIPRSAEPPSVSPRIRVEAIAAAARHRAFIASASLSLPPGPLGWVTVLPELVAIWKIQAKMVADIAAAYGQSSTITREQMLYCLLSTPPRRRCAIWWCARASD